MRTLRGRLALTLARRWVLSLALAIAIALSLAAAGIFAATATATATAIRIGRLAQRVDLPLHEVAIEFAIRVVAT